MRRPNRPTRPRSPAVLELEPRRRFSTCLAPALMSLLLTGLAACGGGGKKSDPEDPPLAPNDPPVLLAPQGLGGASPSYTLTLPIAETRTLLFTASDPENAVLQWQLAASPAAATAAGLVYDSPTFGTAFDIEIRPVTAPAAVNLSLLVEDPRGGAAAIDLRVVRSGAPVLTGITPQSAFATRQQRVQVKGTALLLGGAVTTALAFDGQQATDTMVVDDTTIVANTPPTLLVGPADVRVANVFGQSTLPGAFYVHAFPPVLAATDTRLDAGGASAHELARAGNVIHGVWLEGAIVVHRRSTDRGATWSLPAPLSGAEAASEPQVAVGGDAVTVAWIGDSTSVWIARSTDGGATFLPAQRLDPTTPVTEVRRPRVAQSGEHRYVGWQSGDFALGSARVRVAASANGGASWTLRDASAGANQHEHELACDGATAWMLSLDGTQAQLGAWIVRTVDGGATWQDGRRLNSPTSAAGDVVLLANATRVFAAWRENGGLWQRSSPDRGATWATTLVELESGIGGVVTSPRGICDANQAIYAYTKGGTSVRTARFVPVGSVVQRVTLDATATVSEVPSLATSGNYVFVAWREDTVASGNARIQYAVSTDGASTFEAATPFGNGPAAQDHPRLGQDGAHVFFAWRDLRDPTSAIYSNRTSD